MAAGASRVRSAFEQRKSLERLTSHVRSHVASLVHCADRRGFALRHIPMQHGPTSTLFSFTVARGQLRRDQISIGEAEEIERPGSRSKFHASFLGQELLDRIPLSGC